MAQHTEDPYPWVTVDEDGKEFRTHTAHEDGVDEHGNEWSGWEFRPRTEGDDLIGVVRIAPVSDPYPWVRVEDDGSEFRTHTAHEDGVDANGDEWFGWEFRPRTTEELEAEGF